MGVIRVVDCDRVEPSNVNRQILHCEKDISKREVDSAAEKLKSLNSEVTIEAIDETIKEDNLSAYGWL